MKEQDNMQKFNITSRLFLFRFITALMLSGLVFALPSMVTATPLADSNAGRTLYVNANSGSNNNAGLSVSDAFRTLNYAMDRTRPGDTVLVMNGTYREENTSRATLRITEGQGGTADNWITYKAYPGHNPRIQSNGHWFAVDIRAPYIIIDGFEIRGIKNEVSFSEAEEVYEDFKRTGEYNQRVHGHGIATHSYTIIRNNDVHSFGSTGIEIERADNIIVENNRVYDTSKYSPNGTSGISIIYPRNNGDQNQGLEGTKYKIIIRGNTVYDNENLFACSCIDYRKITDGNGIIVDLANEYQGWTLIENNVAFNNGGHGIHTYRTRNIDIINNSLYRNGRTDSILGDLIVSRSENVNVANNVVYLRRGKKVTVSAQGSNIRYKNNIYYDGTDSPDIDSPIDSTNLIVNPRYRNPSLDPDEADFRLSSNSPGIDNATDEFLPAIDIRGAPRPDGSGDRGAYENTSVPPPSSTILGDVNCNGNIDSVDALSVLQYEVGARNDSGGCPLNDTTSELNVAVGDANSDGSVTATDALLILQCSVGVSNVMCPDAGQQNLAGIQAADAQNNTLIQLYLPYME